MSEVQLFTERKEHIHLHSSNDIREQLLAGLKLAFSNSRGLNDLAKRKAESLLIELSEARTLEEDQEEEDYSEDAPAPLETEISGDPPTTDPQNLTNAGGLLLHSIPHVQSDSNTLLSDLTPTPGGVTIPLESDTCPSIGVNPDESNTQIEGVGVIISGQSSEDVPRETPPLSNSNEKA
jgi:hypothetical protein